MTNDTNPEPTSALLRDLAQQEIEHRAPAGLRDQIIARARHTPQSSHGLPAVESPLSNLLDWLSDRWWRPVSVGATAAAIPLLAGVLVGYQLSPSETVLDDPASAWLTSYSVAAEVGTEATLQDDQL